MFRLSTADDAARKLLSDAFKRARNEGTHETLDGERLESLLRVTGSWFWRPGRPGGDAADEAGVHVSIDYMGVAYMSRSV